MRAFVHGVMSLSILGDGPASVNTRVSVLATHTSNLSNYTQTTHHSKQAMQAGKKRRKKETTDATTAAPDAQQHEQLPHVLRRHAPHAHEHQAKREDTTVTQQLPAPFDISAQACVKAG